MFEVVGVALNRLLINPRTHVSTDGLRGGETRPDRAAIEKTDLETVLSGRARLWSWARLCVIGFLVGGGDCRISFAFLDGLPLLGLLWLTGSSFFFLPFRGCLRYALA